VVRFREGRDNLASLVDKIEKYIRQMIEESDTGIVEIQRNQLADQFSCVPSQINYVLQTRFTFEKGYFVESRRGGGGYIRVSKLELSEDEDLMQAIHEDLQEKIKQKAAEDLIERLEKEEIITLREAAIMQAVIDRRNLTVDSPLREYLRANLLKAMLVALIKS
jgi:transcriptional regulator CtsR